MVRRWRVEGGRSKNSVRPQAMLISLVALAAEVVVSGGGGGGKRSAGCACAAENVGEEVEDRKPMH